MRYYLLDSEILTQDAMARWYVSMMDNRKQNRLIVAIKRCIEDRFTFSDWDELGYLTNGTEIIQNDPRLLRSLSFRDDDYGSRVFNVIELLVKEDPANLQIIIDYIELQTWLREHAPRDFDYLYGQTDPILDGMKERAITNSFDLNQHIARIRGAIETDSELAVGSTKDMLESVLKSILQANQEEIGKDDLPQLLKKAQKILKLDPSETNTSAKGSKIIKRTLSNLGQVVNGIDELRNIYGTGHGRIRQSGISPRHARLVVNAGAALAIFLMDTFEHHQKKEKQQED